MKWIVFAAFLATVPLANWLIGNIGTECIPHGPCLVPVGFGLMAPSGVLVIGAALVLRDAVQSLLGARWALMAIALGVVLSAANAPPALVLASAVAFGLAELADMAVYTPLRQRGRIVAAILMSGIVGAVVDSAAFLWLAFGSLDYVSGQIVGKMWMTTTAAVVLAVFFRSAPAKASP
jgi:uncharacterized PurR-regulated membrane protein YhhQ (DUF165 family)